MTRALGTVVVAGALGGFGRRFAGLLEPRADRLHRVDLSEPDAAVGDFLVGDVARPGEDLLAVVRSASCILLCVPERATMQALDVLVPELAPGALVVDITSVKTPMARRMDASRQDIEVLSLNPLFGPDLGFEGHNVMAVPLRAGPRADALISELEQVGARVVSLTAAEHDEHAAITQAAVHAGLLAYGVCLARSGYDADPAFMTPPQRALLALVARVVTQDPEVYRHIQSDNPRAAQARDALVGALGEVTKHVTDPEGFEDLFALVAESLRPSLPLLIAEAEAILSRKASDP